MALSVDAQTSVTSPLRVMTVDDSPSIRASLRALLDLEADIEVVGEAADGKEGVTRALELRPDVILLDIQMPGMDGIEAARALKQSLPATAIVFFVGEILRREEAMAAGADAFLLKDTPFDTVLSTIREVGGAAAPAPPARGRSRAGGAAPAPPPPLEPAAAGAGSLDEVVALRRAAARLNALADQIEVQREATRRETLAAWGDVARSLAIVDPAADAAFAGLGGAEPPHAVQLDVGPFPSLAVLTKFVDALVRLPGVGQVQLAAIHEGRLGLWLQGPESAVAERLRELSEFRPELQPTDGGFRVELKF